MIRASTAKGSKAPPTGERRSGAPSAAGGPRSPDQERRSGIVMTPQQVAARRAPTFLEGPTKTLTALGVLVLFAVVFLGTGYSRPLNTVAPLSGAYKQTGTFSYTAAVKVPTPVYPTGRLTTGQPIYPNLVDTVTLSFAYHFASPLPHHVTGTISLKALLLSKTNTWQQLAVVKAATAFTGDTTTLVSTLPLKGLYPLIDKVSAQSGAPGASYAADIQPVVTITGTVGGHPIKETYSPVLPFDVAQTAITLDVAVAPAPPGATYVAPTASSALATTLNPTQAGSVPHLFPNVMTVAKYKIRVSLLRTSGLIFVVLALLAAALHDVLRRRMTVRSDEELIAKRYSSLIVPVDLLADAAGSVRLGIRDFAHLAELAQFLERPILYEMKHGKRTYAVDDGTRRYLYQPAHETAAPAETNGSTGRAGEQSRPWTESDRAAYRARQAAGASFECDSEPQRTEKVEADAETV
jgi:hypothetical protein